MYLRCKRKFQQTDSTRLPLKRMPLAIEFPSFVLRVQILAQVGSLDLAVRQEVDGLAL
jgi:hypothetical protein